MSCGTVITLTRSDSDEELTFHSPDQAASIATNLLEQLPEGTVMRLHVRHADGGSWSEYIQLENGQLCASFDFTNSPSNLLEAAGFMATISPGPADENRPWH